MRQFDLKYQITFFLVFLPVTCTIVKHILEIALLYNGLAVIVTKLSQCMHIYSF